MRDSLQRRRERLAARRAVPEQAGAEVRRHDRRRDRRGRRWRRRGRGRAVGIQDGHDPEHAVVLHPLGALDEWPERDPVRSGHGWRDDGEVEPRDLIRADVRHGLDGRPVVAGPSGDRGAERPVAAERARAILARHWSRRAEVRDLAHPVRDPAARSAVVERDRRDGAGPGTERHVAALAMPRRVEPGKTAWLARRWRDAGSDAVHAARRSGGPADRDQAGHEESDDECVADASGLSGDPGRPASSRRRSS